MVCEQESFPEGVAMFKAQIGNRSRAKFKAQINFQGKTCYLGLFSTSEAASDAFQEAKRQISDATFVPQTGRRLAVPVEDDAPRKKSPEKEEVSVSMVCSSCVLQCF
jgi:hypothetical protein